MTDERLIKGLRLWGSRFYHESGFFFVADRIEQLVATNKQLEKERDDAEAKLAKAVEFIQEVRRNGDTKFASMAIAVLAELEKKE